MATKSHHRVKRQDIPLHISHQNVKDGVAGDPHNCTFGQCALSRQEGMDFFVDPDPFNPQIWAEWTTREEGKHAHHRAEVVRLHRNGRKTKEEAITIVAATDIAKKALLRKFPKAGMDFLLTDHTVRFNAAGAGNRSVKPGETEDEAAARRLADRMRTQELKELRAKGVEPPAKRRKRAVRARFG